MNRKISNDIRKYDNTKIVEILKQITGMKSIRKTFSSDHTGIFKVKDQVGNIVLDRKILKGILNEFYAKLYQKARYFLTN